MLMKARAQKARNNACPDDVSQIGELGLKVVYLVLGCAFLRSQYSLVIIFLSRSLGYGSSTIIGLRESSISSSFDPVVVPL
jgi:hypothetical protein